MGSHLYAKFSKAVTFVFFLSVKNNLEILIKVALNLQIVFSMLDGPFSQYWFFQIWEYEFFSSFSISLDFFLWYLKVFNVEVIYFLSCFTSRDCDLWYESQINPFLPSLRLVMVLHHSDDNRNLNTAQYTSVHPTSTEWQFSVEEILWAQSPLRVLIHCPTLYKSQYYLWRTISTCLYK